MRILWILIILCLFPRPIIADELPALAKKENPAPAAEAQKPTLPSNQPNFFAESFYLKSGQRVENKTYDVKGLVFVENPDPERKTKYAIVTDFGPNAIKTRSIPNLETPQDVQKWVSENVQAADFQGVEIKKVALPSAKGESKNFYWVGHKAYPTLEAAQADIALVQTVAESQKVDFKQMVAEAEKAAAEAAPEAPEAVEIKTPAQFQKEEEIALKFLDQLDVGNELFGAFQGPAQGEPIVWQSFGETTWRSTNLTRKRYNSQVGFWTNRVVFKGIRAPLNTIDPYLEVTPALESNSVNFASHMDLVAGIEWRPFGPNPWLENYRPGGIPLLVWVRNFRFFLQYMDRTNLKNEILNSRDYDLRAGVQIFYEWGIDLPTIDEGPPNNLPEFLRHYLWGEYFGDYHYEKTDFTSEKVFNAFLFNSSIILGFKLPGIPLPDNPINDKLILMPYFRFEHTDNTEFSFSYQNYYFLAVGVRWMPFNNYRYKENEWLSKTKLFMEYVGVGGEQFAKQGDKPAHAVVHDLRFGVNISHKRF